MKRFATSLLIAACVAWPVAGALAASSGEIRPRRLITDEGNPPAGQPGVETPAVVAPPAQPPVVTITGPAGESSFLVGSTVQFTGSFTDNAGDVHAAQWRFASITTAGVVTESSGSVTGSWTFDVPGIYFVSLTVTDEVGHADTATTVNGKDAMIVVFDRGDGFVDGHGRFDSPAGALVANPLAAGRMDFDFDARYRQQDMVPSGGMLFKFNAGSFEFEGTTYDWFDCDTARALLRGRGTINGAGDFAFLLSGVDGDDMGGGALDRLRIKITDPATGAVVYDNQMGAPDTAIATMPITAGDVNVRLPNGGRGHLSVRAPAVEPAAQGFGFGFGLAQNSPNPFRASTRVRFSLPQRSHVKLAVFDVAGREIATLAQGPWDAGSHSVTWMGTTDRGERARRGVYFVHLTSGLSSGEQRLTSVRKMIVLD